MKYDFDEIIERKNTCSYKYDLYEKYNMPLEALPLWVADMDFRSPEGVTAALRERLDHGVYGYSEPDERYFQALYNWYKTRFNWEIKPEWLVKVPNIVYGVCGAIRAYSSEGDAVIIQQPVYYPFENSIRDNDRKLIVNELILKDGRYYIDFADFEKKIIENKVKLFILCSPHNPVGRVWTREELLTLGNICLKHNVIIIADEIHADFTYNGYRHQCFADISPEIRENSVVCTSPAKTFNLAGMHQANLFISNENLRELYNKELRRAGFTLSNLMGMIACRAAYETGAEWLDQLKAYLTENLDYLRKYLNERIPEIKLIEPEGTYLVWLDCRALKMNDKELDDFIINKARLWLDAGTIFGVGGSGFQRINIACPKSVLTEALTRLETAVQSL
jgi:cystathionine beta-lyase